MSGTFYNLGKKLGPKVRKAKWVWHSATGTEADAIKTENEVGRDLASEVRCQLALDTDPKIRALLKKIGSRLSKCVANRYRTFSFECVEQGKPNAFALPGGFIFITRSLIELSKRDKDELAFVLSHEMAHVIRGHAMERIMSQSAVSAAARVTPARSVLGGWLKRVGIQFLESAYSQDLETESDRLAVRLTKTARYDPNGAIRLLSRLAELNTDQQDSDLSAYLSSHPPHSNRILSIQRMIAKLDERS